MNKDSNKLCSHCYRLKSFSYVLSLDDNLIMKVKCKEFPRAGLFKAKDKNDTCIGFIPNNAIPVPCYYTEPFIKESEMIL